MRKYSIRITKQAREHLNGIKNYIEKNLLAPEAAYRKVHALRLKIKSLSSMPARVKLVEEEPWRSEGLRKMVVENYYVYFWIDEEKGIIQVTAVVYAKRDQNEFLKGCDSNKA